MTNKKEGDLMAADVGCEYGVVVPGGQDSCRQPFDRRLFLRKFTFRYRAVDCFDQWGQRVQKFAATGVYSKLRRHDFFNFRRVGIDLDIFLFCRFGILQGR